MPPPESDSLDEQAKKNALRHVSQMFQRPDQLERIEMYKKRTARKQASVEAMLKTGVSSQLEGVRTGMSQLEAVIEDISAIRNNLDQIDASFKKIAPLKQKLHRLKEESYKLSQYAAARENLQHIFDVPKTVEMTQVALEKDECLKAHKYIMELEGARDDLLFELHKQKQSEPHEIRLLQAYFSEVDAVAQQLGEKVFWILRRTLDTVRNDPSAIVTALRIIEREERIDEFCLERQKTTQFVPPSRPRGWRKKCFQILRDTVRERIEGSQFEDRSENKHWLAIYLEMCRQRVTEDLMIIQSSCVPCFPPEYDIYKRYTDMYHQAMAKTLQDIAALLDEAAPEDKKTELIQLLAWLKGYHGPHMLGNPALNIAVNRLLEHSPLLPQSVVTALTKKFLEITKQDMSAWLTKAISQEKDDWYKDEQPIPDNLNIMYTNFPAIVIQMADDQISLSQEIETNDAVKVESAVLETLNVCLDQLLQAADSYKAAFLAYKGKHFEDRDKFRNYAKIMVSIANNCHICADSSDKLRSHAKTRGVTDITKRQELLLKIESLKEKFTANTDAATQCLLEEVLTDINSFLVKIMTRIWLTERTNMGIIVRTIEDYVKDDHMYLKAPLLTSLLTKFQCRVIFEYLKAAENKRISFANEEDRKNCAEQMSRDASDFKTCLQHLSPRDCDLELFTDVLQQMSEVLRLSDKSLLSLEVSSFVQKYPDITHDQLSGLVNLREDVNRSEARSLAEEILKHNRFRRQPNSPHMRLFQPDVVALEKLGLAKNDSKAKATVHGGLSSMMQQVVSQAAIVAGNPEGDDAK